MEIKGETKNKRDKEKGRVIETKEREKKREEKWNITTGRYWKRRRHRKKRSRK